MKKILIFSGKYLVSIVILSIIFSKIEFDLVQKSIQSISHSSFLLLVFIAIIKLWTQFKNWQISIRLDRSASVNNIALFRSYFIGLALRFTLPGGAGSFGKAYFLNHNKKSIFASVGVEKIIQNWGNLVLGGWVSYFIYPMNYRGVHLFLVILVSFFPLLIPFMTRLFKNSKHRNFLHNYKQKIIQLLSIQLFYICLTTTQYYIILKEFRTIHFLNAFSSTVLILMSNTIPITIQGAGLRESFAVFFLGKNGFPKEEAVTAALLIFLINGILPAFIGLYFIIINKKKYAEN